MIERKDLTKLANAIKHIDIALWGYMSKDEKKRLRYCRLTLWDLIKENNYSLSTDYRLKKKK